MGWGEHTVTVVNPRKVGGEMAGKKKKSGKRKSRSKKRRSNSPAKRAAPKRRRGRGRSRRRRRNAPKLKRPTLKGFMGAAQRAVKKFPPKFAARLAEAIAVRKFGDAWGTSIIGDALNPSPYAGQAWTLKNYGVSLATGIVGSYIIDAVRPGWGDDFAETIVDSVLTRFFWTEIVARSGTAQKYLGADPMQMMADYGGGYGAPAYGPTPDGYIDDGAGNRWATFDNTGYQQAMLGLEMRQPWSGLQRRRALGALEQARALDMSHASRGGRKGAELGHLFGERADPYMQSGYSDPYQAANSFRG